MNTSKKSKSKTKKKDNENGMEIHGNTLRTIDLDTVYFPMGWDGEGIESMRID